MLIAYARRFGLSTIVLTFAASGAAAQTRTISLSATPGYEWLNTAPAFIRDQQWDIHLRTYYLYRDNFDASINQAWAGGGWIGWQSGFIHDLIQIGATLYTSQPLYAPAGEGGTLLLNGQSQITTLAQAWVLARINKQVFTFGRQLVDTPLINPRDNRMIPVTYTGVILKGTPESHPKVSYAAGYLWDYKPRDVPGFSSMSSAFDVADNIGAAFASVRVEPMNGWHFAAMDYLIPDTINSGYAEIRYDFPHAMDSAAWTFAVNDMFQGSVGAGLISGSPFTTHQGSAKLGVVYNGWTLSVAGSLTGTGANIQSPFGSKQNYTDMQQSSFDRAGEDAVVVAAAYDFTKHGWAGVSAGASLGHGFDAINPTTGAALPNRTEYDLFLQYRPVDGKWQGFRFQAKYANLFGDGFGVRSNQPEFRLIADYSVLLKR